MNANNTIGDLEKKHSMKFSAAQLFVNCKSNGNIIFMRIKLGQSSINKFLFLSPFRSFFLYIRGSKC